MHASAIGFGTASRSSARNALSTELTASGISLRSPRMYAGSRLALRSGGLCSHWSWRARARSRTCTSQYLWASPLHVATANVDLLYQSSSICCFRWAHCRLDCLDRLLLTQRFHCNSLLDLSGGPPGWNLGLAPKGVHCRATRRGG